MKNFIKKATDILRLVFGYGILISLFAGGLTFFGYLAALIIGGESATLICVFIQKTVFPIIIRISTVTVLLGILIMYLSGEVALTSGKSKQ